MVIVHSGLSTIKVYKVCTSSSDFRVYTHKMCKLSEEKLQTNTLICSEKGK